MIVCFIIGYLFGTGSALFTLLLIQGSRKDDD